MIHLADVRLPALQVLVCGRVFDSVSGRGLERYAVSLSYSHSGGAGALPVRTGRRADGWFSAAVPDVQQLPDLSGFAEVELSVHVTVPGRPTVEETISVPGAELAVVTTSREVAGTTVTVAQMPGAPRTVTIPVAPPPVALAGVVLRDHDPAEPVAGVAVAVDGVPSTVTDAAGRFLLPALPVAAEVVISLGEDPERRQYVVRPDYDRPVNVITLSLPR